MRLNALLFLITSSVFATLHIIALQLFLYWQFLWFDIPMHILGGVVVALGIFGFAELGITFLRRFQHFPIVMTYVLAVTLLWEGFELAIGMPFRIGDGVLDVCMGLLGGAVAYFVAKRIASLEVM